MMVIDDFRKQIPLRETSRISAISLSGYYYRPLNDSSFRKKSRRKKLR
jgi:hypothetical protein